MAGAFLTLAFGADHLDDLPASCDQIGEKPSRFIRQGADRRPGRFSEMSDHGGVDRIGFRPFAKGVGERPDLRRIDDDNGVPAPGSAAATIVSKPPVASTATSAGESARSSGDERVDAGARPIDRKALHRRPHMHVEPVF